MSLFPSLSTRALPEPLLLHAPSCNPRMDVALLSNPTTSGTDASLHLYRLSGGSTSAAAHASGSITGGTAVNPAGRVWESTIEGSATPAPTSNALNAKSSAKGKGRQSNAQGALYQDWIPPRLAETVAWSPDGQLMAFASSTESLRVYSVHDGKPALANPPLSKRNPAPKASTSAKAAGPDSLYLLAWEDCMPPSNKKRRRHRHLEVVMANKLEWELPRLPALPSEDPKPKAKNTFMNPFMAGPSKPHEVLTPLPFPPFPSLPSFVSPSLAPIPNSSDEDDDYSDDEEYLAQAIHSVEQASLLSAGDEKGNLHLLYKGAIDLGCIPLGRYTDIISCLVYETVTTPRTVDRPARHNLRLALLLSVPLSHTVQTPPVPPVIASALPPRKRYPKEASTVIRVYLDIPNFPSKELALLSHASSCIQALLSYIYTTFDDARKLWEEALSLGTKWLSRLESPDGPLPALQLLQLLLTGKPANTDLHEYLASKNTERSLLKWETSLNAATAKLRNAAFMSITPACERIILWIDQMREWARMTDRFGHLDIQLSELDACIPLVQLIMVRAADIEHETVQEELGFREFSTWMKFELERIAAIEAHAENRPTPKHDVVAVMTYIKTRLFASPLTPLILVEKEADTARYAQPIQAWLRMQVQASEPEYIKKERKLALRRMVAKLEKENPEFRYERPDLASVLQELETAEALNDEQNCEDIEDSIDDETGFVHRRYRLFTEPIAIQPEPTSQTTTASGSSTSTRRKSVRASLPPPADPVVPTELSIAVYLSDLTSRLTRIFEHSFQTVTKNAVLCDAMRVTTWSPPDREEDDAMTALGLARDPTKITTRIVHQDIEDGEIKVAFQWMACETPPGSLLEDASDPTFWLICIAPDKTVHALSYTLEQADGGTYEILDIEFFDDQEVALLLRNSSEGSTGVAAHKLATVMYRQQPLEPLLDGQLQPSAQSHPPTPIPLHRVHRFGPDFEPLQFSLNGRDGRRVGCILGNLGRVLEVLDMATPDDDEAEEEGEEQGMEGGTAEDAELGLLAEAGMGNELEVSDMMNGEYDNIPYMHPEGDEPQDDAYGYEYSAEMTM